MEYYIIVTIGVIALSMHFFRLFYDRFKSRKENDSKFVEPPIITEKKIKEPPKNYMSFLRASRGKKKAKTIYKHQFHKKHFGNFSPVKVISRG